jgi:diaminohydroxyphosphoribosylaminopyrimidine deaminase / 5-amino-6-(5-phosphoribosylamino)uracil reductase
VAPSILGDSARGLFAMPSFSALSERVELNITDVRQIGEDMRVTAKVLEK